MNFALCATRNMYKPLLGMIKMLQKTQNNIENIYCFVEDAPEIFTNFNDNVHFINVSNFDKVKTTINSNTHWTYMTLLRCYFTELLSDIEKIIYLDLDIILYEDLSTFYNMNIDNYAFAGVVDSGAFFLKRPITITCPNYINAGVLLMNLKYLRDSGMDKQILKLLTEYRLDFPDQDAINVVCKDSIKIVDCKWNSSPATTISEQPAVFHTTGTIKPWMIDSPYFAKWCSYYFS